MAASVSALAVEPAAVGAFCALKGRKMVCQNRTLAIWVWTFLVPAWPPLKTVGPLYSHEI